METTYRMIGGDGKEYGPISLEQMRLWVREGRIAAETSVQRGDGGGFQPASSFPELALGAPGPAPAAAPTSAPAAPAPLTGAPAADGPVLLASQVKSGASWFYWIAGLSVVNSVAALSGSGWGFVVGLGVTQIIDHIAHGMGSGAVGVAVALDILAAGLFALFGLFANKGHGWAFVVGMVLYAGDGLLLLLGSDWLGLGFHVFALFCIFNGYRALKRLRAAAQPGN